MRDRIFLNVLVKRDGMSVTGAARFLGMAPSWGVKWHSATQFQKACQMRVYQHPCVKQRQRIQKAEKPGRPIAAERLCLGVLYHSNPRCARSNTYESLGHPHHAHEELNLAWVKPPYSAARVIICA